MEKNWLVTGGAGFIGVNLSKFLLSKKNNVIVVDNLSTGNISNVNICEEFAGSCYKFFHCDVNDIKSISSMLPKIDTVVHLAAQVSVPLSIKEPFLTHEANVNGFLSILTFCKQNNVNNLIYASSCSVYGESKLGDTTESTQTNPQSFYAVTKLTNELYANSLVHKDDLLKTIGLRFFNIYGPYQSHNHPYASVIPKWIYSISQGIEPKIYGTGKQIRDFCHVFDLCEYIYKISEISSIPSGEIYNICTNIPTNLLDLYGTISRCWQHYTGMSTVPRYSLEPSREGDIEFSLGSNKKIKNIVQYQPQITLESGIQSILSSEYKLNAN